MLFRSYSLVCTCEFNAIFLKDELVEKLTVEMPDINNVERMYKCGVAQTTWLDTKNNEWVVVTKELIES